MSAKETKIDESKRALFRRVVPTLPEKEETPENAGPPEELVQGLDLMRRKQFEEAIAPLRTLSKADPNQSEPHRLLGLCLYMDGQYIQARVEFERVIRIEKEDNLSALYLAFCLLRLNKKMKAGRALDVFSREADPQLAPLVDEMLTAMEREDTDLAELAGRTEKAMGDAYVAMLGFDEGAEETAEA